MRSRLTVRVEHIFQPEPEAVRRAIEALIRLSDQARARQEVPEPAAASTPDSGAPDASTGPGLTP